MAPSLELQLGRGGRNDKAAVLMLFTRMYNPNLTLSLVIAFLDRPLVGGISGGKDGAYSVALSGGYDDDVDLGYALCVLLLSLWLETDGLILRYEAPTLVPVCTHSESHFCLLA